MEPNLNQTPAPPPPIGKDHEAGREFSRLALASISIDGGTQARAELDPDVIEDYAAAIEDGATFPPIIVYYDGKTYWLADGFHRHAAAGKAGLSDIASDVRQGTRRDAILHSVGANAEHGLRRNNEDKRRAVKTLLNDTEWSEWSDREIGRRCHVSAPFVAKQRGVTVNVYSETERRFTTRHGTAATMKTSNIGSTKAPARPVTRTIDAEFRADPDFQAEAEEAARDLEMERDERISLGDTAGLVAENESLRKQVAALDRRIAALVEENGSLKARTNVWQQRAVAAGWKKGRADA
jgi:hypothetical protein